MIYFNNITYFTIDNIQEGESVRDEIDLEDINFRKLKKCPERMSKKENS